MINLLKKHAIIIFLLALTLTVISIKLWPVFFGHFFPQMPAAHVESLVLKLQPGQDEWHAMGTVKAGQDIVIASEVAGTIDSIAVANSESVNQGTLLINIRHDDIKANLERDQAILAQKQLFYQRVQKLIAKHAISEMAISEAKSAYQQAEASVAMDKANLDKYIIKAPFKGRIGIWQVDKGQLVQPGIPLVTLTALNPTYIDFMLPAKDLDKVKVDDKIQFKTASFQNRTWLGKVIAFDPQLDGATRSIKFRALVDNADNKLVPRLYGDVTVQKSAPARLLIPQDAITYNPEGASVYVLNKNMATARPITLGEHINDDVVITSGLKENDEIIIAGMMKVFPGMPVTINKKIVQATPSHDTHLASSAP